MNKAIKLVKAEIENKKYNLKYAKKQVHISNKYANKLALEIKELEKAVKKLKI